MKTWTINHRLTARSFPERRQQILKLLLQDRNLTTKSAQENFLKPPPPQTLTPKSVGIDPIQLKAALARIRQAVKRKDSIIVYGDYDADGICATAILWEALHALKANALPFIPHREDHGYGLSLKGIKAVLKDHQPGLIITVDNGIVAQEPAKFAHQQGIDLIITDHHQPAKKLPPATAIVHTDKLSGAGVAWMLAKALHPASANRSLDLAALATVADMVPLLGPNRQIVKFGLKKLQTTDRLGLLELFQQAALDPQTINTYTINFILAPRLNATGRLGHALDSLRLLCTHDKARAQKLAQTLGSINQERQQLLQTQLNHARNTVKPTAHEEKILIVHHSSYHQGVIGLIAGRLTDEFYRPSIVLSVEKDFAKASARSISGFNIIKALRQVEHLLLEVGGHPMAAGFSIAPKNINSLKQKLSTIAQKSLTKKLLQPRLNINCQLEPQDITWQLYHALEKFAPFGIGNPRPTFSLQNIPIANSRVVGAEGKHLKLKLQNLPQVDTIGFSLGYFLPQLLPASPVDLAFTLDQNTWNGRKSLQLKLKDLKVTGTEYQ